MSDVETLARVLSERQDTPAIKRLRLRVRELGDNARDELAQFELLRKACREDPALGEALTGAGLPDLTGAGAQLTGALGAVVQAFNTVIEEVWSRRSTLPGAAHRIAPKR
jgi:hypothetical protein